MIWLLVLVIVLLALFGGLFVAKLLWLLLLIAIVLALFSVARG